MDNLNDKKIDALFQEGSEQYDFTYREDAWSSMDEMLDKQEKKKKYRFIVWWLVVGLAGLTGIFGLKYYNSTNELAKSPEQFENNIVRTEKAVSNDEKLSTTDNAELSKTTTQNTTPVVTKNKDLETAEIFNTQSEAVTPTELPKVLDDEQLEVNPYTEKHSTTYENLSRVAKAQEGLIPEKFRTTSKINTAQKQIGIVSSVSTPERVEHTKPGLMLPSSKVSLLSNKSDALSSIKLPKINNTDTEIGGDEKPKSKKRFSFGLTAGSEFSFLRGEGEGKAGYFVGFELGYQINNHFELMTGVGVSKKRYAGAGENYNVKSGFWTDEIVPMEFRGSGTVIEIPLSVNYYFNDVNENGWFTNLGVTTYLMSNEWYDFIYDPTITRTDLKTSWNDKMENKHLLGVAQVSFGYQRTIGKHTSLQISPYAKIPLTGIGTGSVNLFSTGIRLTARLK